MPPHQCPACGRFLAADLVAALAAGPRSCPRCGEGLTADAFDSSREVSDAPGATRAAAAARPRDVLAGWDPDGVPESWRDDRPPFPLDAAWVGASAVVGGLAGALGVRGRRLRGLCVGAAAGALLAGIARRIWESPDALRVPSGALPGGRPRG